MKVLATQHDPDLGGVEFDRLLADHFADEFQKRYRINARSNPRAFVRLLAGCERLKKLMSANTQEIPLNIECFMEDKDVTGKMNRATFEALAADLLIRVETAMRAVLQSSSKQSTYDKNNTFKHSSHSSFRAWISNVTFDHTILESFNLEVCTVPFKVV